MDPVAHTPREHPAHSGLDAGLLDAVVRGEARLTAEQALTIFREMPLAELGRYADARARAIHGDHIRTYVIDRNINYTNVCTAKCTFCAFRRDADDHDAYTLTPAQIHDKIRALVAIGGTQVLMQGGMNPNLPLDYYLDLLASIKSTFPGVHVHAFSPPEMVEFVNFFNPPGSDYESRCTWVLQKLRAAGLDSLPGGGGEIFADPVRRRIGLGKCDATHWLTTMRVAHRLGMFTSATMMFGHVEGHADRVHHMLEVRRWQDQALAAASSGPVPGGHYTAFISWPFQRENTPLGHVPDWGRDEAELAAEFPGDAVARAWDMGQGAALQPQGRRDADVFEFEAMDRGLYPTAHLFGKRVRMSGAIDYLRTQALSRLVLDNIYSIGSSWVTMGPHVGQLGLHYGATDMGSVMMEENVVSAAGTTYCLDEPVLCRLIREAGFTPAQRNNTYDVLRLHDGPDAPDRRVTDWSAHRTKRLHIEKAPPPTEPRVSLTVGAKA